MKKFFALCAVASMFVACAKESTDSLVEDFLTPEENAGQVAVQFKSNVTASVQTSGMQSRTSISMDSKEFPEQ